MRDKTFVEAFGYTAKGARDKPADGWSAYLKDPCDGWEEEGVPPRQGERTDLVEVSNMIKEGKPMRQVAEAFPLAVLKFPQFRPSAEFLSSELRPLQLLSYRP